MADLKRFLWLAFLLPGGVFASDSLLSLYQEAQTKNAAYLSARAAADAEKEAENIALGQLLPSVGASSTYGKSSADRQIGSQPSEHFDYGNYSYGLNLRQPVFRMYNIALYQQSKAQGEAASAELRKAANQLAVDLATAYVEALYAEDQLKLLEIQKAAVATQLTAAEKGVAAGAGTRVDVDEARARLDTIEAQQLQAENLRQDKRRVLGAFVNRELDKLPPLDIERFRPVPPEPGRPEVWLAEAEANNADYQGLLAQRRAAEQEVEKSRAGHYPTLDLVANVGRTGNDSLSSLSRSGDTEYNSTSYGVQVNIPLFAGGQVNATVRQSRAKLEKISQSAEETRRNIAVQTRREYDNVINGLARIKALEQAESSGRQTVQSAKRGVRAGVRSMLDVLTVEQAYFTTLRDLSQARYAYLIAGLRLKGLAGQLGEPDIAGISAQFSSREPQLAASPTKRNEAPKASPAEVPRPTATVVDVRRRASARPVRTALPGEADAPEELPPSQSVAVPPVAPQPVVQASDEPPAQDGEGAKTSPGLLPRVASYTNQLVDRLVGDTPGTAVPDQSSETASLPGPAEPLPATMGIPDAVSPPAHQVQRGGEAGVPAKSSDRLPLPKGQYLQLGAFSSAANAEKLKTEIAAEQGGRGPLMRVHLEGGLHRLYAGPFTNSSEAGRAAAQLRPVVGQKPILVSR